MKKEWNRFKAMKGRIFIGLFENRLDTFQTDKALNITSDAPLVEIREPRLSETTYWKFGWIEENDDDILLIEEQETPKPYKYEVANLPNQKHFIMCSSYACNHNVIKNVKGFGFRDDNSEFLYSVVLELEESYITIKTGAFIQTIVSKEPPINLGMLIFTS